MRKYIPICNKLIRYIDSICLDSTVFMSFHTLDKVTLKSLISKKYMLTKESPKTLDITHLFQVYNEKKAGYTAIVSNVENGILLYLYENKITHTVDIYSNYSFKIKDDFFTNATDICSLPCDFDCAMQQNRYVYDLTEVVIPKVVWKELYTRHFNSFRDINWVIKKDNYIQFNICVNSGNIESNQSKYIDSLIQDIRFIDKKEDVMELIDLPYYSINFKIDKNNVSSVTQICKIFENISTIYK